MQHQDKNTQAITFEELESFQAELLVYITDDIKRLSSLIEGKSNNPLATDILINKVHALGNFKNKLMKTLTIIDLMELANQILIDPAIIKNSSGKRYGITTVEENILCFLQTIYNKFSIVYSDNRNADNYVGSNNIYLFTDQIQLSNLLNSYIKQYALDHHENIFPQFNDRQMVISQDNAIVMFDLEGVIASGDQNYRKKNAAISKVITSRIIDALAYLLAQDINPLHVHEKLRLCIGVNHGQRHWTGLVVDIDGFFHLYQAMYIAKSSQYPHESHANDVVLAGRQLDTIYQVLGLMTKEPTADQLMKALSRHITLNMNHYDSMNCVSYYNEIFDSAYKLMSSVNATLTQQHSSQQKGNTCGDHTTCNLVGVGLYGITPVINEETLSSLTSSVLRNCTNAINEADNADNINFRMLNDILQDGVLNHAKITINASIDIPLYNPAVEKLMHFIDLYAERIYLLAPENATELFHELLSVKGDSTAEIEKSLNEKCQQFKPVTLKTSFFGELKTSKYNEIQDRVMALAGILHNTNNKVKQFLFRELDIANEDCIPYGVVSRLYLQEKQSVIESKILHDNYPIKGQETAINTYNKK